MDRLIGGDIILFLRARTHTRKDFFYVSTLHFLAFVNEINYLASFDAPTFISRDDHAMNGQK